MNKSAKLSLITPKQRLTFVLFPNTTCAEIVLSDRMINKEPYSFQREKPASGHEERMIKRLMNLPSLRKVVVSKQTIRIELARGVEPTDWVQNAILIITEYCGEDYSPTIHLDDQRWFDEPVYSRDEDEWEPTKEGVRIKNADIGVPYIKTA